MNSIMISVCEVYLRKNNYISLWSMWNDSLKKLWVYVQFADTASASIRARKRDPKQKTQRREVE